jgi:hypothetical protein
MENQEKNDIFVDCYKNNKNNDSLCHQKNSLSSRFLNLSKILVSKVGSTFLKNNKEETSKE